MGFWDIINYSHWGHLVQKPQILSGFKDKNSHALIVSCMLCFTQVLYKKASSGLIKSLFVKHLPVESLAFFPLLPGHRCAIFEDFLRSSFSMPDQVPVAPVDRAVAAAVDPPVVALLAPADAAGDNNAQNANDNVVPVPQPAAPEVSVSLVLVFV